MARTADDDEKKEEDRMNVIVVQQKRVKLMCDQQLSSAYLVRLLSTSARGAECASDVDVDDDRPGNDDAQKSIILLLLHLVNSLA